MLLKITDDNKPNKTDFKVNKTKKTTLTNSQKNEAASHSSPKTNVKFSQNPVHVEISKNSYQTQLSNILKNEPTIFSTTIGYFPAHKQYIKINVYSNGKQEIAELESNEVPDYKQKIRGLTKLSLNQPQNLKVKPSIILGQDDISKNNFQANKASFLASKDCFNCVLYLVDSPIPLISFKKQVEPLNKRFNQQKGLVDQKNPLKKTMYHKVTDVLLSKKVVLAKSSEQIPNTELVSIMKEQ